MTELEDRQQRNDRSDGVWSRYLEGNYAPVAQEVTAYDLEIEGELHEELTGRCERNGPNPICQVDPPSPQPGSNCSSLIPSIDHLNVARYSTCERWMHGPRTPADGDHGCRRAHLITYL